jgi:hypothetical protein
VDLETKLAKLGKLSGKRGLKVSKLQIMFKANKKAAVADLSLQKKIYKKELKVETNLTLSKVKAQINISRDVESSKKILQKKFDAQAKMFLLILVGSKTSASTLMNCLLLLGLHISAWESGSRATLTH